MPSVGSLPKDDNSVPVQVAGDCVYQDGTGTPQTSPLAFNGSGGAVVTIVVPTGGDSYEFRFSTDVAVRVSTTQANLASNYYVHAADRDHVIPCRRATNIYVRSDSVTAGTIQFMFHVL